ncbi:MAG: porin [Aliarcobacter sp.]|nr:porin [Aliarcobacter sp.]
MLLAYFNQTNLVTGGEDLAAIGVLGNVGPVALDGWYLDLAETSAQNDGHAAYSVGAKAKIEMVKLMARYSAVSHDATGADTEKLWKVGADAKFGIVSAGLAYGQTNDANAVGVGLGDADADTSFQAWGLSLEKQADASLLIAKVGVDVLSDVNLSATYATRDNKNNTEDQEYYGQLTYKMGKNFMTYARIGQVDKETKTDDETRGRLHVQYTF